MANDTTYLIDDYVMLAPGTPYRLFPFGRLVKGGVSRDITPELARKFRLPHFKPPIKLGSHDDATPAGGSIIALEVREDGLYAVPEYTEKGAKALGDGDFRYHSPEVIWDDAALEDPSTGDPITGPLILGDALLHTPHLGEAAALYSITPIENILQEENQNMTDESVQVPTALWEKFTAWFGRIVDRAEQTGEPAPDPVMPDDYSAIKSERDDMAAKLAAIEAQSAQAARVERYRTELTATKVSEGAEKLAALPDDVAEWVVTQFKALSAQIDDSALLAEVGTSAPAPTDPKAALLAAISAAQDGGASYAEAVKRVAGESPELFKAAGY
jgi:hypothetical protein